MSSAEILATFDIDSCAVGYDGTAVYASHRAFIAFITQTNRADLFYATVKYKDRLHKYAQRGFKIEVHGGDPVDTIDKQLSDLVGLSIVTQYHKGPLAMWYFYGSCYLPSAANLTEPRITELAEKQDLDGWVLDAFSYVK
jgi:hypothetical protein